MDPKSTPIINEENFTSLKPWEKARGREWEKVTQQKIFKIENGSKKSKDQ